ncbi:MAG: tetratricopeptide repeat protein, partial [Methanospirillum sp.]|nr:tetratricopeptide repeat protein [Methanospirillum sp.]
MKRPVILCLLSLFMLLSSATLVYAEPAENLFNKGMEMYNSSQYEEAAGTFDQVLAIDPGNKEAWFFKGTALNYLGQNEEA